MYHAGMVTPDNVAAFLSPSAEGELAPAWMSVGAASNDYDAVWGAMQGVSLPGARRGRRRRAHWQPYLGGMHA